MTTLILSPHKRPALGKSMKAARAARIEHKDDPFCEPVSGVMRPPVFEDYSAIAIFGDEPAPAGCVELVSSDFAARIFVPLKETNHVQ